MTEQERRRAATALRDLRARHDLHQKDIAQKTGLSVGTVQAIEHQKYEVRNSSYEKYAAVFGMTVSRLLRTDNPTADKLTLRDYFAVAAMSIFIQTDQPAEAVALYAYKLADAMLKERTK